MAWRWTEAQPLNSPLRRFRFGMAYDPAVQAVVMVSGTRIVGSVAYADSWTWDGVTWTQLATVANPSGEVALAMDPSRGRLVCIETSRSVFRTWEFSVFSAAATAHYGTWCGGSVDPHIEPLGLPRAGRVGFAIDVGRVASGAPGGLLLAASPAQFQLAPGCTLWVDPAAGVALPFVAGLTGFASLPLPVPASISTGDLHVQAVVADPGGPFGGLSMSRGLTLTIGR